MTTMQRVYKFGGGVASPDVTEGDASMNYILGGKGANLAEMCRIGLPVPPGFTITCQTCVEYDEAGNNWPDGALDEIEAATRDLEDRMGKRLGDAEDPLLVSVRSGAPFSMPGMMDTVLNLGLNDESVMGLIAQTDNPRFAWDLCPRASPSRARPASSMTRRGTTGPMAPSTKSRRRRATSRLVWESAWEMPRIHCSSRSAPERRSPCRA